MKTLKNILAIVLFLCASASFAQSESTEEEKETSKKSKTKENYSEETVIKITRIKGPNGEEKVIKQEQIITKKNGLILNPNDENKTNQNASYTPEQVSIKNSGVISNKRLYRSIPDGTGYIITFIDEKGESISKARPISNGYYLIHLGAKDNCLGRFDDSKNLILEMFDEETSNILKKTYKEWQ